MKDILLDRKINCEDRKMIADIFHMYFTRGAWRLWTYLLLLELAIIMVVK